MSLHDVSQAPASWCQLCFPATLGPCDANPSKEIRSLERPATQVLYQSCSIGLAGFQEDQETPTTRPPSGEVIVENHMFT